MPEEEAGQGTQQQPEETQGEQGQAEGAPATEVAPDLEVEDAGEPGGAEPQAVRARKEYRARKKLEQDLHAERIRIARLEGELQGRQAPAKADPKEPEAPKYAEAEVLAAVTDGSITAAQGAQYLKGIRDYELGRVKRELLEEVDKRGGTRQVQQAAEKELADYVGAIPALKDPYSREFASAKAEYDRLTQLGMQGDSLAKQAMAVRAAFGPLEGIKRKSAQPAYERDQRGGARETNGSGARPADGGGGSDESQVRKMIAQTQIDYWRRHGKTWKEMLADVKHVSPRFRLDGGRR